MESILNLIDWVEVGNSFYNLKHSFYLNGGYTNSGTHMSLLNKNGTPIKAVIATHPFHTTYFESFYKSYPSFAFYGTPHHIAKIHSILWAGDISCEDIRCKYEPHMFMRIPDGTEFKNAKKINNFSSVFLFHPESKTIHDDYTLL